MAARVAEAWAGTGPIASTVVGPAGIGKSALLRAAATAAHADIVLDACGIQSESSLAYGAVRALLAPLKLPLEVPADAAALIGRLMRGDGLLGVTPVALRLAVRTVLDDLAAGQHILIVLDDVQWLDPESIDIVRFLTQRAHGRVAVVLASRAPMDGFRAPELRLEPLARSAARALLHEMQPSISGVAAGQVINLAEGNPLALSVVARGLSPDQRAGSLPILAPVHHGAITDGLFRPSIDALPAEVALAGALVAAEPTGELETVTSALTALGVRAGTIDELVAAGLVVADGARVTMVHPLARAELYAAASPGSRRRVHAALAEVCDGDAAVWQRAAAVQGTDADVAEALSALAMRCWGSGALASAATALERAARIAPAGERAALLGRAAGAALTGGQLAATIRLGDEVRAMATDDESRVSALLTSAMATMMLGTPLPFGELEREASRLAETHPWWSAQLFGFLITALTVEFRIDEALRVAELARRTNPAPEAWVGSAFAHAVAGDRARAWECMAMSQESDGSTHDLVGRSNARMYLEDIESLEVDMRSWMAGPSAGHFPRAYGLSMLAECCVRRGAWPEARELIATTLDEAEASDNATGRIRVIGLAARLDAAQGNWDDAETALVELSEMAANRRPGVVKSLLLSVIGFVRLSLGDAEGCVETLVPLLQLARQGQWREPSQAPFAADLVEAALQVGDRRLADETVEMLAGQVAVSGSVSAAAQLERCRALLDPARARVHLERALAAHAQLHQPFDTARTQLAVGLALGDAELLADAAAGFRALGAEAWVRRAEAPSVGDVSAAPALSAQQLAVARAAARGATTREIASELFISVKTVEYHLGRLYKRYDVRNRAQLATALRESNAV